MVRKSETFHFFDAYLESANMKKIIIIFTAWIFVSGLLLALSISYAKEPKNNKLVQLAIQQVKKLNFEARLTATLKSKTNNNLVVADQNGRDYQVVINSSTSFKPKYWGNITLDDFLPGDKVNVIGNWQGNTVKAVLVRNLSNETRWGVFLGDIISVDKSSLVISNRNHGKLTVIFGNKTIPTNLNIGDRVRVKGIYNPKNAKITSIDEVKDFSIK